MLGLVEPLRKLSERSRGQAPSCRRDPSIGSCTITFTSTGHVGWPRIDQRIVAQVEPIVEHVLAQLKPIHDQDLFALPSPTSSGLRRSTSPRRLSRFAVSPIFFQPLPR